MSNCIKDLFDYDLVKKCCRCQNILLKSNFIEIKTEKMIYIHSVNFLRMIIIKTIIIKNVIQNLIVVKNLNFKIVQMKTNISKTD